MVTAALCASCLALPVPTKAQQVKKPFTVADEIGITLFIPDNGKPNSRLSPDGRFVAVCSRRGRLDLDRPEFSLRFYRTSEIREFLERSSQSQPPQPFWDIHLATDKEGRIIEDWGWLDDSSGVAFLQRVSGKERIAFADMRKKRIEAVSGPIQNVESYDYRDLGDYVYTAPDPAEIKKFAADRAAERKQPAIVGTGRRLGQLILLNDPVVLQYLLPRACLWAVIGGKTFKVKHNGVAISPQGNLALSPDRRSLITVLPVPEVPKLWESLYPPPSPSSSGRIHAGHESAKQYVRINLRTGTIESLTDAPLAGDGGWQVDVVPSWSRDGQAVLLPGTFTKVADASPSRPCVAVVNVQHGTRTCVEELTTEEDADHHTVSGARFVGKNHTRVIVTFSKPDGSTGDTEYQQADDGTWKLVASAHESADGLEVRIEQRFDRPPLLVASNKGRSRVIWDPNPQLKALDLGEVALYRWKDKEGREFKGGLFKPPNYRAGQRYPLVIQTHGFYEEFYFPSGPGLPTAFAARALAATGMVVLQVDEECPWGTEEGPCAASAYESAANKLVAEGLVDPSKIGIIGFSRSCYYVMEALTMSSLHVKAASITSGLMFDYWQSTFSPEGGEGDGIIGTSPFGQGLQQWLKRSPGFNLDKVNAPLTVVGQGPDVLLTMWAAYSGLHQLHKPVELVMLNSDEHVLTYPSVRMASQGGSVDWFRFWLQGYEDPDPAKAEQYKRWRELRKLQEENDKKSASTPVGSN